MTPIFPTLDEVIRYHEQLVEQFGGSAGVRDMGLLQSALAMPGMQFGGEYLHSTLHEMAAAYLFHIVGNHPFIDGNKRTGATIARMFLHVNGMRFDPSEEAYGDLVLAVASGQMEKSEVTAFFARHVRPV